MVYVDKERKDNLDCIDVAIKVGDIVEVVKANDIVAAGKQGVVVWVDPPCYLVGVKFPEFKKRIYCVDYHLRNLRKITQ